MDAIDLIAECRKRGAVIDLNGDVFVARTEHPLPGYLREALRASRDQVLLCLRACRPTMCRNPLTPHADHEHPHECDASSCDCFQLFGKPKWCSGIPCRWVWPNGYGA